ncbi:hypothetical protein DE146DRAFT_141612 [Phaeosphaeria sp. MPI-PUGE-AT-0046c]|nr:hypothetical protein DE146DRAFT_141612 [Phaeosphaeria sp. MPI-PUGE-AT-0046c]
MTTHLTISVASGFSVWITEWAASLGLSENNGVQFPRFVFNTRPGFAPAPIMAHLNHDIYPHNVNILVLHNVLL